MNSKLVGRVLGPVGFAGGVTLCALALGALTTTLQWRAAGACPVDSPVLDRLHLALHVPTALCDAALTVGLPAAIALVLAGLGMAAGSAVASRALTVGA